MLTLSDLRVAYGPVAALHGVSFEVGDGESVALIGTNGAGKSSTLKAIVGLTRPAGGTIEIGGSTLNGLAPNAIVRLGVGYSPEGRRVFPFLSVRENLLAGGYTLDAAALKDRLRQVHGYFPILEERARQAAGSLSGGEQQMLAIARALMSRPRVLLLDEPSLGLGPIVIERIDRILREVCRQEGVAVLLAEQNAHWAMSLAQKCVILELGRVVMVAPSAEARKHPDVQRAFLGV